MNNQTIIDNISSSFLANYETNLSLKIPTIHSKFLKRIKYIDEKKKTPEELGKISEELKDEVKNIDFRKTIYLDFVLRKMDIIKKNQAIKEKKKIAFVNDIYDTHTYDNTFNFVPPIKSLIEQSIIPEYNSLNKTDIDFFYINSHGGINRNIVKLQPNCIVVFITSFNRYTHNDEEHTKTIDNLINEIYKKIEISNNNIFDIIKLINSYKCFDKSTIIYPNQYYFEYRIQTDHINIYNTGLYQYVNNSELNKPTLINMEFNTLLSDLIQDTIIKDNTNKTTVFFVKACRTCNFEYQLNNFTIEKMYIYENFIKILNKSIYEKLSLNALPFDKSIDCKIRVEGKDNSTLLSRTKKKKLSGLILNTTLGNTIKDSDKDVYKSMLYSKDSKAFKGLISNLLKKNKKYHKYGEKIDKEVMDYFLQSIILIINEEQNIDVKYIYIIRLYQIYIKLKAYFSEEEYYDIIFTFLEQIEQIEQMNLFSVDIYPILVINKSYTSISIDNLFKILGDLIKRSYKVAYEDSARLNTEEYMFILNLSVMGDSYIFIDLFEQNLERIMDELDKNVSFYKKIEEIFNIKLSNPYLDLFIPKVLDILIEKKLINTQLCYIIISNIIESDNDMLKDYIKKDEFEEVIAEIEYDKSKESQSGGTKKIKKNHMKKNYMKKNHTKKIKKSYK